MYKTADEQWVQALTGGATAHTGKLKTLQVQIYTAVGGGLIGRMYAVQPKSAYLDSRAGRRPYKHNTIERMQLELIDAATALGLPPDDLPGLPYKDMSIYL